MRFATDDLRNSLAVLPSSRRYLVAFSGGLDSAVLLHAIHQVLKDSKSDLLAIHIDHGLSPQSADWARHCERFCDLRKIPLEVVSIRVDCGKGDSIEARAREERYKALAARLIPGDALVTAHHRDDLAETFLLNALRGSGVEGLAAMPAVRQFGPGLLLRPLLEFSRRELESFARSTGLAWVEDPSNQDRRFDRNYLRHEVMPVIGRRWPSLTETLARAAVNCAEVASQLGEHADKMLSEILRGDLIEISALRRLQPEQQRTALRRWIQSSGFEVPGRNRLSELQRQLSEAAQDRSPMVAWEDAEIRSWRGFLFLTPRLPGMPGSWRRIWTGDGRVLLPADLGDFEISGAPREEKIEVRFREGGESLVVHGQRRPLKKILQEKGVPPWLRNRVPLVFLRDELVAIADYQSADGCPAELSLSWTKSRGWPMRPEWHLPSKEQAI